MVQWLNGGAVGEWGTAVFGGTAGTATVNGTVTVGAATLNATGYTITGGTLALSGATPTFTTNAGVSATISSAISGSATLVKSGAWTLTFTGSETYTGATIVDAGRLAGTSVALRNNTTTFSGTPVVNGIANSVAGAGSGLALGGSGTSNALINANVTLNGTIELADRGIGSGFLTSVFNLGALSGSGIMVANRQTNGNFAATIVLGNTNDSGLFSGSIVRGSGVTNVLSVTKVGTGTQIFSGANSYTGATNVNVGVLNIRNNTALARPPAEPVLHLGQPCRWTAALPSGPRH